MNDKNEKSNIGITTGVAVGFLASLLLNLVLLIPIAIGLGGLFDFIKNRRQGE